MSPNNAMSMKDKTKKNTALRSRRRKHKHHESILRQDDTAMLVVDYQERMVRVMEQREAVTPEIVRLIEGCKMLDVPIIATLQYPQGLGQMVEEVGKEIDEEFIAEKMTFSCCGDENFWQIFETTKRKQVIVTGVETHVCVLQTVLDLLANNYSVHVPVLATCSRSDFNRDLALERMQHAGAILTNTESVLFELMYEAGTEQFKRVRKLIV